MKAVRLPARSPNLNSFAERFVLSIKSECLSKIIPLGESHLRRAIREFVEHYHSERPHQGIGNVPIDPAAQAANPYCAKRRIQPMRESATFRVSPKERMTTERSFAPKDSVGCSSIFADRRPEALAHPGSFCP